LLQKSVETKQAANRCDLISVALGGCRANLLARISENTRNLQDGLSADYALN
jgi:hypothetical protein